MKNVRIFPVFEGALGAPKIQFNRVIKSSPCFEAAGFSKGKCAIRKLGAPKMAQCNTCVVDQVVLDIVGQALPGIKTLLELGVCNVARHNKSPTQREARLDWVLGERRTDLHKYEIISHRLQSAYILRYPLSTSIYGCTCTTPNMRGFPDILG
jgi:hypothetical protein